MIKVDYRPLALVACGSAITDTHKDANGSMSAFHGCISGANEVLIWPDNIEEDKWLEAMSVLKRGTSVNKEPHDPGETKTCSQIPRVTATMMEKLIVLG